MDDAKVMGIVNANHARRRLAEALEMAEQRKKVREIEQTAGRALFVVSGVVGTLTALGVMMNLSGGAAVAGVVATVVLYKAGAWLLG